MLLSFELRVNLSDAHDVKLNPRFNLVFFRGHHGKRGADGFYDYWPLRNILKTCFVAN